MALTNTIRSGLSNASLSNPLSIVNAPRYTQGFYNQQTASPTQIIDNGNGTDNGTTIRYPHDDIPYYTELSLSKYQRQSWNTVGNLNWEKTIKLPIPLTLIDEFSIKYNVEALNVPGAIGGAMGSQIANWFKGGQGPLTDMDWSGGAALAGGIAGRAAIGAARKGLDEAGNKLGVSGAGRVVDAALQSAGYAVNEFLTVMLEGPNYKNRMFTWRCSPDSARETEALADIINTLQNAQAPGLAGGASMFFSWPRVFGVEFKFAGSPIGNVLFHMKPMVLVNSRFNFAPNGVFGPYRGTHGPDTVEISLEFMELELWLNSSGDAQDAYQRGSNQSLRNFKALENPAPAFGVVGDQQAVPRNLGGTNDMGQDQGK